MAQFTVVVLILVTLAVAFAAGYLGWRAFRRAITGQSRDGLN